MEDDIDTLYETWRASPTPDNLHKVVTRLEPVTRYAVRANGVSDNPLLRQEARLIAAKAVRSYDPAVGVRLTTWTGSQLRQLAREKRKRSNAVQVPERAQLEMYALKRVEAEFMDKHGREPDVLELSDAAAVPVEKIAKLRRSTRPQASAASFGENAAGVEAPPFSDEAASYVHQDSDYIDRRIIELKTGFGGNNVLEPKDIATTLKLTPSQLSRRSAKIALRMRDTMDMLEQINT